MNRDDHIANMLSFVWLSLGVNLLLPCETGFVLGMCALLDEAIEDEVRQSRNLYRQLLEVSAN